MSSLWPIVCELMFRRRQNGLLGVETPSFNSFLSSHAMCERKKACACVCLCLCVLAQKSVQVLKLWTRSISWKSALLSPPHPPTPCLIQSIFHAFISSSAFFITSYFQLHHLVSRSCSQLFLILLSLFPILSSALLSCLPWTHHGLTFPSKTQFPLPLQMWIIFSWNFFLSVAVPQFVLSQVTFSSITLSSFPFIFALSKLQPLPLSSVQPDLLNVSCSPSCLQVLYLS